MNKWQRWKNIMKCYPFEEKRLAKWQPPYIVQPKYDGVRCRAVNVGGNYLLLSSEENIIYSVPHINKALDNLQTNVEFDGELYTHGMSFEQIVSITSRTVNRHPSFKSIEYHIFDIVSEKPQAERLRDLHNFANKSRFIQVAPFWICESLDDIMKVYDKLIKMSYEGIIVRHFQCPYERKRSTWIMKFKPKKTDEYKIVGYKEEVSVQGVPKGTLGALVCESGDGQVFNVGTGFTEEQRHLLWQERGTLVGKTCIIAYQHLTDRKIPRFPVFVEVKDE